MELNHYFLILLWCIVAAVFVSIAFGFPTPRRHGWETVLGYLVTLISAIALGAWSLFANIG